MKNFCITISLAIFILLSACKKNTPTPQPAPANATISPLADTTKFFYALYEVINEQNISVVPTYVTNYYSSSAYFSPALQQVNAWYVSSNVNVVKANNAPLVLAGYGSYYQGNLLANDTTIAWYVAGKDNIPSFNFTDSGKMPSFNYLTVPDTVDHIQNFILPVNPTRNKTVEVYIKSNGNSYIIDTLITLSPNQTSVAIPVAKMHYLTVNDYNTVTITQTNYNPQSVNGLPMCFAYKFITKKPIFFK